MARAPRVFGHSKKKKKRSSSASRRQDLRSAENTTGAAHKTHNEHREGGERKDSMSGNLRERLPDVTKPVINPSRIQNKGRQGEHLFGEISLCLDKETAKYMPYTAVAFPKIDNQADTSVDTLWMVGFLDYENRRAKELVLEELKHFRGLPGGHVPPSAAPHLRKAYSIAQAEREEVDRNKETQKKARLGSLQKAQKPQERLKLSDEDAMKLRALEQRLQKRAPRKPWAIYTAENRRIRAALKDRNPGRTTATVMRSRALETMFELEREHRQAALCIQQTYRRYRMHLHWQDIVRKSKAVKVIQRYVRGMLARTLVRVWLLRKSWLVIVAQSCVRGYLSRKRTRERIKEMQTSVSRMQAIVRGYLGRLRADFQRSYAAATKIQRVWRGSVTRVKLDRAWLDRIVTKIQKYVRGQLGRKEFQAWHAEAHKASITLQCAFRGVLGRWQRNKLLWDRETERQREFIRILRAEDEYICEEIAAHEYRVKNVLQVNTALEEAKTQYEDMLHLVREKIFDYEAMQIERGRVDPLAMRQGWTDELDKYVKEHRQWLTNAKFEFLFVGATFYRQMLLDKAELDEKLKQLQVKRERIGVIRQAYVESLYQREARARWELRRRDRRRRIADQRRRWQVKWYTEDGKVDKKRRSGYPWDPSIYAGPEHDTMYLGGVNIAPSAEHSATTLDYLLEQVALQNAQNEFVQHGSLIAPLMDGMDSFQDKIERHIQLQQELFGEGDFAELNDEDENGAGGRNGVQRNES